MLLNAVNAKHLEVNANSVQSEGKLQFLLWIKKMVMT